MSVLSVVTGMNTVKVQNDEISRLFRFKPNPLQTTKDFLACCEWLRRKDCNCFIYPQYEIIKDKMGNEYKYYTAFWPLNPTSIEIGVDDTGKVWEIKFHWRSGGTDIGAGKRPGTVGARRRRWCITSGLPRITRSMRTVSGTS